VNGQAKPKSLTQESKEAKDSNMKKEETKK
jgi:hypothetical protein